MFGRFDIRYKIMLIWLFSFIILWAAFKSILPLNSMKQQLNKIEECIARKNWTQANEYTREFKDNFIKNRVFIQMNNSTEALTNFEYTIGQLEMTVKYNQESALEYIGALRDALNLVIKPFSGP